MSHIIVRFFANTGDWRPQFGHGARIPLTNTTFANFCKIGLNKINKTLKLSPKKLFEFDLLKNNFQIYFMSSLEKLDYIEPNSLFVKRKKFEFS